MKKRILSGSLALAMTIALIVSISIPASAMISNGFYIADNRITENKTYYPSDFPEGVLTRGSITKNENTLTLNNVTITSNEDGIHIIDNGDSVFYDNATIELIGENIITTTNENKMAIEALSNKENGSNLTQLTIKSASGNQGILKTNGGVGGIVGARVNLLFSDCTVNATGSNIGIGAEHGNINIENSTVTAASTATGLNSRAIFSSAGSITSTNSNVTTAPTSYVGLGTLGGNITINGGKVLAGATKASILAAQLPDTDTGKINLLSGVSIKRGGVINTVSGNQVIGNNVTYNADPIELTNAATDVLICGDGTISAQAKKPSTISSVTLPNNTDLQNAVLTDADKAAIANGENVNIQLIINSVQAPADSDKVQQGLGSNTLGMYLDISMIKTVGTTQSSVHTLNAPIRLTFTIPDNLKGKDNYCIIRVHDGVTTILNDLDNDPNTVTFETDRFSTYALAYSNVVNTSDNSNIIALAFMTIASLGAVAFIEKKKVGIKLNK